MPPRNRPNYCGASGTITPAAITKLGPGYMVQPKLDGAYCHVHLDPTGCIARVSSRTGRDFGPNQTGTLVGQFVGYPNAVLVGELTASTEAGIADAKAFGAHRVHVFDLAFGYDAEPLARKPYSERRAELHRMQAKVELYGPGQTWYRTEHGIRDRKTGNFTRKTHTGLALTPIVPQVPAKAADSLWDQVRAGKLEGLVAVSQGAPMGRRGSKRKCKQTDTLDVVVIGRECGSARCLYGALQFWVNIATRDVCVGDMLEIAHNGWYNGGTTPRFPRIVRRRDDLMVW